jgi:hypothetical protein
MSPKMESGFDRAGVFFLAEDDVAEGVLMRSPFFNGEPFFFGEL